MAKKIKFALVMADGCKVRTMEDLREHFDLAKMTGYFLDGKLQEWLADRYYDTEVGELQGLDTTAVDFSCNLCAALGGEYEDAADTKVNIEAVVRLNEKRAFLQQRTDDADILSHATKVALTQEDLADLLEDGIRELYLCGEVFTIPMCVEHCRYIGILGTPEVRLATTSTEELTAKNIVLQHVLLPESLREAESVTETPEEYEFENYKQDKELSQKNIDELVFKVIDEIGEIVLKKEIVVSPYIDQSYDVSCRFSSHDDALEAARNRRTRYCDDCNFYLTGFCSPNICEDLAPLYIMQVKVYFNIFWAKMKEVFQENIDFFDRDDIYFEIEIKDNIRKYGIGNDNCFTVRYNEDVNISEESLRECFDEIIGKKPYKRGYITDIERTIDYMDFYEEGWFGREKKVKKFSYWLDFTKCANEFEKNVNECAAYIYNHNYTQSIMEKIAASLRKSWKGSISDRYKEYVKLRTSKTELLQCRQ